VLWSTHPLSEIFFGVLKDLRHTLAQLGRALPEYQAALQQEGTQLVDHGRSSCDQAVAHTMQSLQIELVICLDRHKSHVLAAHCLSDRLCIEEVVLVGLHKRLHKLSRNQLHIMALFKQDTTKEVSTRTRLQADQRGLQVRCESNQLPLGELLLQQHHAVITERHQVKARLARSIPTERICRSMILLEPAYKIFHTSVKFKRRTISVTPFLPSFISHLSEMPTLRPSDEKHVSSLIGFSAQD
jgi:hypothetical protein